MNSGGSFGANPLRQTIGLGSTSRIQSLHVLWPTTGITEVFTDVPIDQIVQIIEGEGHFTILDVKKLTLASSPVG